MTDQNWKPGEIRHAGLYRLVIDGDRSGFICEVQAPIKNDLIDERERDRRTHLIAAAPRLLMAVRENIARYRKALIEAGYTEQFADLATAGDRALIADAEGQS